MVIGDGQVLDARALAREGGGVNVERPERDLEVIDPGAMGTLLIGLNADRANAEGTRDGVADDTIRRERHVIRVALARGLRRAAAMLDRPAAREAADQAC
jgi:hypothetical protein